MKDPNYTWKYKWIANFIIRHQVPTIHNKTYVIQRQSN